MSTASTQDWQHELSASERELLREVALALRGIRYGSVVLTVHDRRIVDEQNRANSKEPRVADTNGSDPTRSTGGIKENGQPTSPLEA
jgi:hypothetical protein